MIENKLIGIVCGIILAAFLVVVSVFCIELKHAHTERDEALKKANDMAAKVELQNYAIDQLKTASDVATKKLQDAEKKGLLISQEDAKRITDLNEQKVPTSCQDSIKWGIQKAQQLFH